MKIPLTNYRPDIDGLRAIAVLAVVLYHANIQPFGGGYVGVDVFFVISGYLITSLIHEHCRTGQFSIVQFYERRVRRIFPALFATVAFCFLVGCLLMMPLDYKQFGYSAVANALFASNLLFWLKTGYFDTDAEVKPLLHTWSLGVEEQFYILFPCLLLLLYKFWRNGVASILSLLLIASLFLSVWQVYDQPTSAFYLPLGRAWELLVGALLALSRDRLPHRVFFDGVLGLLGMALIFGSIFSLTADTPFPGLAALPACLGTAAIIYSGEQSKHFVPRLLSLRIVVLLGIISYSLYLWHWPLLVFAKYFVARQLTHFGNGAGPCASNRSRDCFIPVRRASIPAASNCWNLAQASLFRREFAVCHNSVGAAHLPIQRPTRTVTQRCSRSFDGSSEHLPGGDRIVTSGPRGRSYQTKSVWLGISPSESIGSGFWR